LEEFVKEKFKIYYFIFDKFFQFTCPFYIQLDKEDNRFINSFNIFFCRQKIIVDS